MANGKFNEKESLKSVLGSFLDSYAMRDEDTEFSGWLGDRLSIEMPDMSKEACEKLSGDIIRAVDDYDKTLGGLNDAIDAGQSKEEWFVERLAETYNDMPYDAVGKTLTQIENDYTASNMQLMHGLDTVQMDELSTVDDVSVEWNEYSLKDKAYKIGKQVVLSGMAVAANVVKDNVQDSETVDIGDVVQETLKDGLIKDSKQAKAVVAGAVKVAAVRGFEDILPEDTPVEAICDIAGVAVEGAEALFDVANGEGTMTDALDKIGRAGVAAGCRHCAGALEGFLLTKPFGPLLVDVLGGLLDHMKSPQFARNVYVVVHDAAVATWEGVKDFAKRKVNSLKNMLFN